MDFTEIAFQNVVGFPVTGRFPLAVGLNAFVSPETDLFLVLRALFGPLTEDVSSLRGASGPRKVALTIHGDDGQSYRLVRDLDGGRLLLRADPATKRAVKLGEDPAEIERILHEVAGVPHFSLLRQHLWLAQADHPSRRVSPPTPSSANLLTVAPPTENVSITPDEARRRLPELQGELQRAAQFEATQDQLYELQQRLGEMNKSAGSVIDLEKQVLDLTMRADSYRKLTELTGSVEARIKKFPEILARRDGALLELQKKRNEYEQQLARAPSAPPLMKDPLFLGGLAGGAACVVAAISLASYPWLWMLDILGFGVAAVGAWLWVGKVEGLDRGSRRLADLQELEKRIHKQFEGETAPLYAAMSTLGVNSPEEVLFKLEERDLIDARRIAALRELEQRRSDPQFIALDNERRSLEQEVRAREAYVHDMGFTRESSAIQRDITMCEQAIAGAGSPEAGDPLWAAVEAAGRFASADPRALLESMRDRLGQYLTALTDRRFVGIRWAAPSACHVVAATGAAGPLSGLPVADQDVVYVGLRLALAEKVGAVARQPIIVDEPSVLMDAAHRGLLVKMLKALGTTTQVIVRAFDAPPAGIVDHIARAGAA